MVAAVREVAPVPIVNGGGTGKHPHDHAEEDVVTEITAGSGFYAPTLFDRYSSFSLTPAAMFAMPVVRKPERLRGHAAGRRLSRLRRRGARPAARTAPPARAPC